MVFGAVPLYLIMEKCLTKCGNQREPKGSIVAKWVQNLRNNRNAISQSLSHVETYKVRKLGQS